MSNISCEHFMQFDGNIKELCWEEDDILVERNVEAWVCDFCGDTKYLFEESECELTEVQ